MKIARNKKKQRRMGLAPGKVVISSGEGRQSSCFVSSCAVVWISSVECGNRKFFNLRVRVISNKSVPLLCVDRLEAILAAPKEVTQVPVLLSVISHGSFSSFSA